MNNVDSELLKEEMAKQSKLLDSVKQDIELVIKEILESVEILDSVKYELNSRTYTLSDDEFEKIFFVRDRLQMVAGKKAQVLRKPFQGKKKP